MAHLLRLDVNCGTRRATHALRNERNEVIGHFCERCGPTACAKLQAEEDGRHMRRGDPPPEERR